MCKKKTSETKKALSDLNYAAHESNRIVDDMATFEREMQRITEEVLQEEKYIRSFSGYRAAALLLFFMNPKKHFFYKSREYNTMKGIIGYKPSEDISDYENCQIMSEEILDYVKTDDELCAWYEKELNYDGVDPNYHLLVQDILWSTRYYDKNKLNGGIVKNPGNKKKETWKAEIIPNPSIKFPCVVLTPRNEMNYEETQRKKSEIGLEGEFFVIRYEEERLKKLFPNDETKRPQHDSQEKGDGIGYDIRSFDEEGNPIYIEVKTTSSSYDKAFYITEEEKKFSIEKAQQYRLYRVYNFKNSKGNIGITAGSLEAFCERPVAYKVILKKTND